MSSTPTALDNKGKIFHKLFQINTHERQGSTSTAFRNKDYHPKRAWSVTQGPKILEQRPAASRSLDSAPAKSIICRQHPTTSVRTSADMVDSFDSHSPFISLYGSIALWSVHSLIHSSSSSHHLASIKTIGELLDDYVNHERIRIVQVHYLSTEKQVLSVAIYISRFSANSIDAIAVSFFMYWSRAKISKLTILISNEPHSTSSLR